MAYLAFELSRVKSEDVAMMGSRGIEWESFFPSGEHGTGSPSPIERVVLVTLRLGSIDSAEPGDGSFL